MSSNPTRCVSPIWSTPVANTRRQWRFQLLEVYPPPSLSKKILFEANLRSDRQILFEHCIDLNFLFYLHQIVVTQTFQRQCAIADSTMCRKLETVEPINCCASVWMTPCRRLTWAPALNQRFISQPHEKTCLAAIWPNNFFVRQAPVRCLMDEHMPWCMHAIFLCLTENDSLNQSRFIFVKPPMLILIQQRPTSAFYTGVKMVNTVSLPFWLDRSL